jgi:hypothetical protein
LQETENRVLRRIFGRNRKAAAGGWRKLHDEFIKPDEREHVEV